MDPSDTSSSTSQQQLAPATPPLPVQEQREEHVSQPPEIDDLDESHLVRGYD